MQNIVLLSIGGNSIIEPNQKGTYSEQVENLRVICKEAVVPLLKFNYRLLLTFGKGPEIRNTLIQEESAGDRVPIMPFDVAVFLIPAFLRLIRSQNPLTVLIAYLIRQKPLGWLFGGHRSPALQNCLLQITQDSYTVNPKSIQRR